MTRQRRPPTLSEGAETVGQLVRQPPDAEQADARRRQFDGQRNAVQAPAQIGHRHHVVIDQLELTLAEARPFDEQSDSRIVEAFAGIQVFVAWRHFERTKTEQPLAVGAQRFPACGQELHLARPGQDGFHQ